MLYVLCLYKAQISGERLQDHCSSSLIFVGIGVTFACDDFIVYVILKKGCLSPGKLTNCHLKKNLKNCKRVVVFRKVVEQKKTEIRIHLTSEYKLYSGMNFRTISSSSFKSRSVLFLL